MEVSCPAAPSPVAGTLQRSICIVHIPKTGGATLKDLVSRAYPRVSNAGNRLRDPARTQEKLAKRKRVPDGVLIGHVPYGTYRSHMPDGARYVTLLRETVDRVMSYYFRYMHGRKLAGNLQLRSISQALDLDLPQLTNLSTRFLCDEPSGELSGNSVAQAKQNLRSFAFVGLQERFDESMVLLQQALGLENLVSYGASRHVNEFRPSLDAISDTERRQILARNALDAELYEFGRSLFEEFADAADAGWPAKVERLREMRAPILAEYEAKRRAAASWLGRALPSGTTRFLSALSEEAVAAGLDELAIKDEIKAMPAQGKAVILVLADERRLVSSDSRFLTVCNNRLLFLDADESRALLVEQLAREAGAP